MPENALCLRQVGQPSAEAQAQGGIQLRRHHKISLSAILKDENNDAGHWKAQFEYDALRKKMLQDA